VPELPEVETTRRGLEPHVVGRQLVDWTVRERALRWPVELPAVLRGERLSALERRAKYLLFRFAPGRLMIHLGMSGSLRILPAGTPPLRHDHVDLCFAPDRLVRLNDPRRFGSVLWWPADTAEHVRLAGLGVEPLAADFSGRYLWTRARGRRVAVKSFIMDGAIVVGVGKIYAAEALFLAGIRPTVAAGRVSRAAFDALAAAIRSVLTRALADGGTTLRDFVGSDGRPGYFRTRLNVYGRGGEPCRLCATPLASGKLGQRATVYCPSCQRRHGFRGADLASFRARNTGLARQQRARDEEER
jgi:formamidopyrimidine-DNA glycosylase